jgi:energy-coupling factor transporter ATP-binding protein EcfA2
VALADGLLPAVDKAGGRFLLGITGPPGAGKTTLAEALAALIAARRGEGFAVVAPMDGFHLSNPVLEARGRRARKGAPDTFDAEGFVRLLRKAGEEPKTTVLWPEFVRELDEPTPEAIAIAPPARLVITEGELPAPRSPVVARNPAAPRRCLVRRRTARDPAGPAARARARRRPLGGRRGSARGRERPSERRARGTEPCAGRPGGAL